MAYFTLILGLAVFTFACILDFVSSSEMSKYGIPEKTSLVRDKKGFFSPVKALVFIVGPIALVLIAFIFGNGVQGFDRVWAGLVLLPGAGLHLWAYFQNKKAIAAKKQNTVHGGSVL